jgi:ubiquinone biosynthesis protein
MTAFLNGVLAVPSLVITVLLFGAVIRRLLGIRLGPLRTFLAAVLAILVAAPVLHALMPDPETTDLGTGLLLMLLDVTVATLLAMIVVVVAEAVIPEGSLPGPVATWRGARGRLARVRRYVAITRIAMRHGLGRFLRGQGRTSVRSPEARRELARSLRRALDEGGVTFVKLGQQRSIRRDLLPAELVEELATLQDDAAPIAWADVRAVLTEELSRPVDEVFDSIEVTPLAAASVAQVHAARLADGTDVVVKVQRPGIVDEVARDLDIVMHLARSVEARAGWAASLGVVALADGLRGALFEELDFTIERQNLEAMGELTASSSRRVRVPKPYGPLSTKRVLVMERITGTPLGAAEAVLAGLGPARRREAATALLDTVLDGVLDRGLFHVDLHPGNLLVEADGTLVLLDLGSVGRLDTTTRRALGSLLAALGTGDSLAATDALLLLVDRPESVDDRELERDLGELIVRFAGPSADGVAAFGALFRVVRRHRLAIPPQVAAVFRTFANVEGDLAMIDPAFDVVAGTRAAARDANDRDARSRTGTRIAHRRGARAPSGAAPAAAQARPHRRRRRARPPAPRRRTLRRCAHSPYGREPLAPNPPDRSRVGGGLDGGAVPEHVRWACRHRHDSAVRIVRLRALLTVAFVLVLRVLVVIFRSDRL